jgi:phage regulator Rha-like protein
MGSERFDGGGGVKKRDLIVIHYGKPFTTTLAIAEGVGMEHAGVIKLVRKFKSDFEEFGFLGFQIQEKRGTQGAQTEFAELNEDQATYLMTLFRNTPIVRAFKIRLVKAFRSALNELDRIRAQKADPAWKATRDETRVGYKWMSRALEEQRAAQGKATGQHHYANEARMLNALLSGKYAALNRDRLTGSNLDALAELQRVNAMLLARGIDYRQRKDILQDQVTPKLETAA